MNQEHSRVFRAAAELMTFDIEALAEYSGVSEQKVRGLVDRDTSVFERIDSRRLEEAEDRPIRYRIKDAPVNEVAKQCNAEPKQELSAALAAGYDNLLRRVPATTLAKERAELILLSRLSLQVAESRKHPDIDIHRRSFSALIELTRLEEATSITPGAWKTLSIQFAESNDELGMIGEIMLAAAIGQRFMRSSAISLIDGNRQLRVKVLPFPPNETSLKRSPPDLTLDRLSIAHVIGEMRREISYCVHSSPDRVLLARKFYEITRRTMVKNKLTSETMSRLWVGELGMCSYSSQDWQSIEGSFSTLGSAAPLSEGERGRSRRHLDSGVRPQRRTV